MKKVKTWIIKNWLTAIMYIMIYSLANMYRTGADSVWIGIMYVLTLAVARTEGGYIESFKTEFFREQLMKLLDKK